MRNIEIMLRYWGGWVEGAECKGKERENKGLKKRITPGTSAIYLNYLIFLFFETVSTFRNTIVMI